MAHVKQVRQKTYPSMVLMPSLYKIGYGLAAALFGHRNAGEELVAQTQCGYARVIPSALLL